ncbi:MAG TPA: efflux RND transporter permease subunit [Pirellulales bacterium]|nr:efflux RND transporter permease subunit [Pirellulales bacterium]
MVAKLIQWSLQNPLIVILLALALAAVGGYSFYHVNVEAYPDPAPAIVEVIAQYPGRSAEEMERLVTIPLEVVLSGMPGLKYSRSKSLFGLSWLNFQFEYGFEYLSARQEVINRLQIAELPDGVTPEISPRSPIGEILRYAVTCPKDAFGNDLYNLNDLRSLESWTLEREFRRIPGVVDVTSFGGTLKRYEIHPDPDRMKRYGITLEKLRNAIAESNANVSGDYLIQGETAAVVRSLGLFGRGRDPMQRILAKDMDDPVTARDYLRAEEQRRLRQIRQVVISTTNNAAVRVDDIVDGGPLAPGDEISTRGVVVGFKTRLGKMSLSRPLKDAGDNVVLDEKGQRIWIDEEEAIQGLVLLRKGAESLPTLNRVKAKIDELNGTPGRLPPGVKIETYYDRTDLINTTTDTVHENLLVGIVLVTVILLMFLSNVRSAIIIAINLPLALVFAFFVLFAREKSANLLSIGAVDFGIIIDSTVIMVENIYRVLSTDKYPELSIRERIVRAAAEIERALFFSTLIMVCALLPLFTMKGPEGQLFRPMAETYAFALGGALLLAVTIAPVLCFLMFKNLRPSRDNLLVRFLKNGYLRNLRFCLNHRWAVVGVFGMLIAATIALLPHLGREFMPPLEEGHIWLRGIFPVSVSLLENDEKSSIARAILRNYPEVETVVCQLGRPESGTDPIGFYSAEFFIPLKPFETWEATVPGTGWRRAFGEKRARTKVELIRAMNAELSEALPGVNWNFSQVIRDNVLEVLSGVQGENSVKIIGPDLVELEKIGQRVVAAMSDVHGIKDVGLYRIMGQTNLELPIDRQKCSFWNISVADVLGVIETTLGGKTVSKMIEGEKTYDIIVRWPQRLRADETAILDIPVDVTDHVVTTGPAPSVESTALTGAARGLASRGFSSTMPSVAGSSDLAINELISAPRERIRDLVTPQGNDPDEQLDPQGQFVRPGASMISREMGMRQVAVKFGVRERDLAGAVAEAQERVRSLNLIPQGYRDEWSGEFQQMQEGEQRLRIIIPLSLTLIFILLYLAFHSLLDAVVVLFNVVELSLGGLWALYLTGTNFSISAAVGFTSIFGVAIMDGLLLVSAFNQLRAHGLPLREAILQGAERRLRPVMMTALTAIFGLLPAALSTKIGAQNQKPLAIVVVGSMVTTLFLTRYLMPVLYSFYGDREPPPDAGGMAH